MKPKERYRERPKKTGAKKRQRVKSQIRRLVVAGYDEKVLKKMNIVQVRDLIKKAARKHTPQPKQKSKSAKRKKA